MTRNICVVCRDPTIDKIQLGDTIRRGDIVVHYFCLLLSSNLQQKGEDDEGIYGFLKKDINAEIRRSSSLICIYCKKPGANIGCCHKQCRKTFHLPCAVKNNCLFEFYDTYRSFCHTHSAACITNAKYDKMPPHESDEICNICKSDMGDYHPVNSLSSPCCGKLTPVWYHKYCMMSMAQTSGYFFKCPLCNNTKEFRKEVVKLGIYIPDRDAAWELEPGSYSELNEESDQCYDCKNPHGSKFREADNLKCCEYCGNIFHKMCINKKTVDGASDVNRNSDNHDKPEEIYLCSTCEKVDGEDDETASTITSTEEPNSILNTHFIRSGEGSSSPIPISNSMLTQWLNQRVNTNRTQENCKDNSQEHSELIKENVDFDLLDGFRNYLNDSPTPMKAISYNIVCTCRKPELKLNECEVDDIKGDLYAKLNYGDSDSVTVQLKEEPTCFDESLNRFNTNRTIDDYFFKLESDTNIGSPANLKSVNTTVLSNDFKYACRIDGSAIFAHNDESVLETMGCKPKIEETFKTIIPYVLNENHDINDTNKSKNGIDNQIKRDYSQYDDNLDSKSTAYTTSTPCKVCLAKALEAEIINSSPFKLNKRDHKIRKSRSGRQEHINPSPFKQQKISQFFKPEAIDGPSTSRQSQEKLSEQNNGKTVKKNSNKSIQKVQTVRNGRSSTGRQPNNKASVSKLQRAIEESQILRNYSHFNIKSCSIVLQRIDEKQQQKHNVRRNRSSKIITFNVRDKKILDRKYQPTVRLTDIMLSNIFKLEQITGSQQQQSSTENNSRYTPKAKKKRFNN